MESSIVRPRTRNDRVGWEIVAGAFVVLTTFFAGMTLLEPVWPENTRLLIGLTVLLVVPPLLGIVNGLRGGSVGVTFVIGATPSVAALVIDFIEILAGEGSFVLSFLGSTLVVGVVGMIIALCGFAIGYVGRTVTTDFTH